MDRNCCCSGLLERGTALSLSPPHGCSDSSGSTCCYFCFTAGGECDAEPSPMPGTILLGPQSVNLRVRLLGLNSRITRQGTGNGQKSLQGLSVTEQVWCCSKAGTWMLGPFKVILCVSSWYVYAHLCELHVVEGSCSRGKWSLSTTF